MEIKLGNKQETNGMRFVHSATAPGNKYLALRGIFVDGDRIIATDGKRIHVAPTPSGLEEHQGKILEPSRKIRITPQEEDVSEIDGEFPTKICDNLLSDEPLFTIVVDKDFLRDATLMPGQYVTLGFTGSYQPMTVSAAGGYTAVIMPTLGNDAIDGLAKLREKNK